MRKMIHILPKPGKVFIPVLLCILHINAEASGRPSVNVGTNSGTNLNKSDFHAPKFDKKITGKVTGENGQPLAGASVVIKGSNAGTATDAGGNFSLNVPDNTTSLLVSYTGYISQEISIKNKNIISVSLKLDDSKTSEVVVVGYGVQKKSDLTGSVSSIKGADLTRLPTQRVDQALQGRASGVSVQNTDGEPGGNVTIRVRGGNSVIGGNNALIVIDGLQGGNISTINPNDVESVEVLKDASATAIYGARGANGVILITTKKGAVGKPSINYSFSTGVQKLSHKLDLLNGADYARKSNDYAASINGSPAAPVDPVLPFTNAQIDALDKSGGTDWQNVIYQSGKINNHLLSVSGGSDAVRYFVSGGYMDQQGILVNSAYKRYTFRSNLDLKINKWISGGFNLNVIKDKGNVPPTGEGTYFGDILGQVINTVARFDPATPVYDAAGNYNFKALRGGPDNNKGYADADVWNPLATALETSSEKNNINNEISTFLEFKLLEGLTLKVTGAARINNYDGKNYYNSKTQPGSLVNGLGKLETAQDQYFQNSNILTYSKTFKEKHRLTVTGVAEQQVTLSKSTYTEAQGFFSDNTGISDLGSANQINARTNGSSKVAINSFLGRLNYAFANKYLLTASFRADGSSVFGDNNKWGYFPSASVAWKASEEKFIKMLNLFSDLKLRASWGKTGNQGIAPYQTLATVASGFNYPYNGGDLADIGFTLTNPANPDLKWETTAQTNFGVDMSFFNDRISATVDVYKKLTTDLLLNRQLPNYTGFTSVLNNVGSIENKGLEISVSGRPVWGKDFRWTTSANISFNKSKVLALADDNALKIITSTGGGYQIYSGSWSLKYLKAGEPMDQIRGYINLGTWSEAERAQALAFGQLPGEAKWKDVNGDGKITLAEDGNQVIGNATPKFFYGWSNNLSYKSFDLSFLIQGSYGNDIFNAVRIKTENMANGTSENLKNRWTINNQNTDVPAIINTQERSALLDGHPSQIYIGYDTRSSRWVEDGSYIRLKNVTFTYSLTAALLKKIHVTRLSAYVTGANLVTITKYTGYDPEVSSFNRGSRVRAGGLGIDLSNYPTAKTIIFGINLTF